MERVRYSTNNTTIGSETDLAAAPSDGETNTVSLAVSTVPEALEC
jgi:hypothetical protein